jgi:hypothetical protein
MTTNTIARSAYPASVVELLPKARALSEQLGRVPSRNLLMREFKVGAAKANAVRDALLATVPPARSIPEPVPPTPPTEPIPAPQPTESERRESWPEEPVAGSVPSLVSPVVNPGTPTEPSVATVVRPVRTWPVLLLALPAFVAIWSGWVGLGGLTGFGIVHPLPGIVDRFALNTAITLPIGVETYAAYALRVWLSGAVPGRARRYAKWSAIGSLTLGALGQMAYHLMASAGLAHAPWLITTLVASLPVAVLGMGAALAHLIHDNH